MKLSIFKEKDFLLATKAFFKELQVPINYVADEPTNASKILKDTYKENTTFQLIEDVYFVGIVDDAAFEGNKSIEVSQIRSDYDGILIFCVTLHQRENNLLPTRAQLAEISRAFNREFFYTPVVIVFKYHDSDTEYLAFANIERLKYKQEWREGEKTGKVSLLRDINIKQPHRGHEDIIDQLKIPVSGIKKVDSFSKLYNHWQEVFSVSLLNKKFYQEISNWYFWAIKHVTFPNKPTAETAQERKRDLSDLIQEHNATNVIRLLTRLLFVWFIKEKKLIPEELFDLHSLQMKILKTISPYHDDGGMFVEVNKESVYYKAILQNLFFATLNCPIQGDEADNRSRGFRGSESYGKHRGVDWMMRYKTYFKDPDAFIDMVNNKVPFLNGGLFECLDDKTQNLYIDGFSDNMTKGEQLIVPDFLFFGLEELIDLSEEYGIKSKGTKNAAVKGLINILKSYKFTITENTPVEEDVALDPELLGKVFENLLASYNPETMTTARKQTGSFYTPREIVAYMVDESIIAYLKNSISEQYNNEDELDEKLHILISYDTVNPFHSDTTFTKEIVRALDKSKILDPACGSGAFPMGILQKMVHILHKLDPTNEIWKEIQLENALKETEEAYGIEDKIDREEKLIEINDAFDLKVNDPDYARKLYLIENCIYGVDIQPIAIQITKLRFFISLIVDQKVLWNEFNFGIRPLPNLETKFVAANTLINIKKDNTLFYTNEVKELEYRLKSIRHKLFSARTKDTKLKYRQKDEELRTEISNTLKNYGLPLIEAKKLSEWDPYDQNIFANFFDPEWMFDIKNGFDIVIGNPPYGIDFKPQEKKYLDNRFKNHNSKIKNSAIYFIFISEELLNNRGINSFIVPKSLSYSQGWNACANFLITNLVSFLDTGKSFSNVLLEMVVFVKEKGLNVLNYKTGVFNNGTFSSFGHLSKEIFRKYKVILTSESYQEIKLLTKILESSTKVWSDYVNIKRGLNWQRKVSNNNGKTPIYRGAQLSKYFLDMPTDYINLNNFSLKEYEYQLRPKILNQLAIAHVKNPYPHFYLQAALDMNNKLVFETISCTFPKSNNLDINFLLAINNSKLFAWLLYKFVFNNAIRSTRYDEQYVGKIPCPDFHIINQQPLVSLVKQIIIEKERDTLKSTSELEKQVDNLVYKIYNLTSKDIALIEGNN